MKAKNILIIENLQLSLNLAIAALEQSSAYSDYLDEVSSKASDTEGKVLSFCDGEVSSDEVLEHQKALIAMLKHYVHTENESDPWIHG